MFYLVKGPLIFIAVILGIGIWGKRWEFTDNLISAFTPYFLWVEIAIVEIFKVIIWSDGFIFLCILCLMPVLWWQAND